MEFKKFRRLCRNYDQHIGRGKSCRDCNGKKITKQSHSIWFDRKSIQELLDKTDEHAGGIKIYFGEYDEETIDEISHVEDPKSMIGKLTVVLAASNDNGDPSDGAMLMNGGKICPPHCGRDAV